MNDYFLYFPKEPSLSQWGCATTAVGFSDTSPNQPYPPLAHPLDHHFDWARGRVLPRYQIILITRGGGFFENTATKRPLRVEAGDVILLFPDCWHRYRPDPQTGWTEHWIECVGENFDRAVQQLGFRPGKALLHLSQGSEELEGLFELAHRHARIDPAHRQSLLATLGLHILACLETSLAARESGGSPIDRAVQRAYGLLAIRCHQPFDLKALARELGVGHSNLRHRFRAKLGTSPRQHFLDSRIRKTKDLLTNSVKSVKEIAEILGFESAEHLSRQFKQYTGMSPSDCRSRRRDDRT